MCAFVSKCGYVCTCACLGIYICIYDRVCVYVCTHDRLYVCLRLCVCVLCKVLSVHVCLRMYLRVYVCLCMDLRVYVRPSDRTCVFVYVYAGISIRRSYSGRKGTDHRIILEELSVI